MGKKDEATVEEKATVATSKPAAQPDAQVDALKSAIKSAIIELLESGALSISVRVPKVHWDLRERKLTASGDRATGLNVVIGKYSEPEEVELPRIL